MYKILILLLLTSCMKPCYICNLATYTEEEQQEIAEVLEEINNETLYRFIVDYGNLRICSKGE